MAHVVEGIILAAGLSSRMGRPKLLIEIDGASMLVRVLRAALASRLSRVILVTGQSCEMQEDELAQFVQCPRLLRIVNPNPALGMASSLKAGMSALLSDASGVMVILADQPRLTSRVVDRLIEVFHGNPDKIVAPAVRGRRTTPVIFPAQLFPLLLEETGDVGGRNVVNNNPDKVVQICMDLWYDDTDVDTPDDLQRFLPETTNE
ncbi:MAG: nucleotidyltransferase family protein [Deltaproteobacteria bacterium]|nr:nucleotidyltransferase family protein [Deltaproteobacteria bacterium]